jgi:hypothetical protein
MSMGEEAALAGFELCDTLQSRDELVERDRLVVADSNTGRAAWHAA